MFKFIAIILVSSFLQTGDWYTGKNGIAIEGFDLVSYFEGKPEIGSKEYSTIYEGATFWFSSQNHLTSFQSNPDKYLPEYGGYCAFAIADYAEKVKIDPKTFKVTDGRLFLFYNFNLTNTLTPWIKNETALIKKADKNWQAKFEKE